MERAVLKRESRRLHYVVACVRHPLSMCEVASWLSTKLSATDELSQPVVISIRTAMKCLAILSRVGVRLL